jgi:hypothetical protein
LESVQKDRRGIGKDEGMHVRRVLCCTRLHTLLHAHGRWVVVMPRYPSPVAPPGTERVVRTLMVCYKGRDQCVPACKARLCSLACTACQPMCCYLLLHAM